MISGVDQARHQCTVQEQAARRIDRLRRRPDVDGPFYNQGLFLYDPHHHLGHVRLAWRKQTVTQMRAVLISFAPEELW